MKLTQDEVLKLLDQAEKEFSAFLAKAESEAKPAESMAKSEESEDKKEDKKDEAKEESAPAEDKKEEAKDEDKKEDEDKHDYDNEDMEEMHKMYHAMGKAELGIHKAAMEKCWMQKCGDMQVAKSEETQEESLAKSEAEEAIKKAEQDAVLVKSELEAKTKELENKNQEVETLKKSVEELVSAIGSYVTKKGPTRKAITSIEYVKKSEAEEKQPEAVSLSKIGNHCTFNQEGVGSDSF
jgi:hypothetical protein